MKLLKWMGGHLTTLVLSLLLGVIIWVSAVTAANPNLETEMDVPLQIRDQAEDITIVDELPDTVNVTILTPESVMSQIEQENVITAYIDLSDLDSGTYRFPVNISVPDQLRPIRVLDFSPRQIQLTLGKVITRELPVEINVQGEPAIGYQTGELDEGNI